MYSVLKLLKSWVCGWVLQWWTCWVSRVYCTVCTVLLVYCLLCTGALYCAGNLYISSVEAADADTYVCEAQFTDGAVMRASGRLAVISELLCVSCYWLLQYLYLLLFCLMSVLIFIQPSSLPSLLIITLLVTDHLFLSLCHVPSRHERLYFFTLCLCVRQSMHLRLYISVISPVSVDRCLPNFCYWLVHLGTKMNWLGFGVKRSKLKVAKVTSRRRCPELDLAVEWSSRVSHPLLIIVIIIIIIIIIIKARD